MKTTMKDSIASGLSQLFLSLQTGLYRFVVRPISRLLDRLDPLADRFEGTLLKRVLQVSIYPVFIALTIWVGFELVDGGYTRRTFFGNLLLFGILGLIFMPLERLMPFSRKWLRNEDASADVMIYFGNFLWGSYIWSPIRLATVAILVQEISPEIGRGIWPSHWNPVIQVFALLAIRDFFRYWYHRWMHENEIMWRWHAVHHSSQRLYWFNGIRSHPIEGMVSSVLWAIPLAFVQAPVEVVFVTGLLGRVIGRFQHTNMDLRLGPLDYIFSSPKNHRYHHAKDARIGNSNYGGDVIIWDILFGTFYLPAGQEPSDDIGIGGLENYPKSWAGLMLAPFTYGRLKREAANGRGLEVRA
jgi:sterol desaturase/sphingolipid hydroxylase (fatty acid hydroxylase superfamily)